MVVATETYLPAQPASGSAVQMPLGGNGFTSPFACYHVYQASAGDASGGAHSSRIYLDPAYVGVVSVVKVKHARAASQPIYVEIIPGTPSGYQIGMAVEPAGGAATDGELVYTPPPMVLRNRDDIPPGDPALPHVYVAILANTNAETIYISTSIFLFDRRAPELVPIENLFACVAGGANVIPSSP